PTHVPRRHLARGALLLDRSSPRPRILIGQQRHPPDRTRPMALLTIALQDRRDIFCEGDLRLACGRRRALLGSHGSDRGDGNQEGGEHLHWHLLGGPKEWTARTRPACLPVWLLDILSPAGAACQSAGLALRVLSACGTAWVTPPKPPLIRHTSAVAADQRAVPTRCLWFGFVTYRSAHLPGPQERTKYQERRRNDSRYICWRASPARAVATTSPALAAPNGWRFS